MENRPNNQPTAPSDLKGEIQERLSFRAVNWLRLFSYLNPYRGRMMLSLIALLFSTGLGLAFPALIAQLLDSVTRAQDTSPLNS